MLGADDMILKCPEMLTTKLKKTLVMMAGRGVRAVAWDRL